jgi:hypothetical protein
MAVTAEETTQLLRDHIRLANIQDDSAQQWSWVLAPSPLSGRGIVASRDIPAGEVVFHDVPLVLGPRAGAQCPPLCVGCHQEAETLKPCSKGCGLPVCSTQCEEADYHLFECRKLRSWEVRTKGSWSPELLRASVPVRCLALSPIKRQVLHCLHRNRGSQHGFEVPPQVFIALALLRDGSNLCAVPGDEMLSPPFPAQFTRLKFL